jgi:hypothetical protein
MSMEQNEPQANLGHQGIPAAANDAQDGAPGATNGQQQRRRRRRRKTSKPVVTLAESGAAETVPVISAPPPPATDAPPEAGREQVRESREQGQNQPREQNRNPRQAAGGQARPQQHAKKGQQQRQAKGGAGGGQSGGSGQGRNFQKGGYTQQGPRESNPGNGSGQPAGGARRKNKVRRPAPSFVGPMDHSYRTVNGNIADGPPSTMDFRSNGTANGNGNGNMYARNAGYDNRSGGYVDYDEPAAAPRPVVVRDDAPSRILCFIEDLFIVAKMQETARKLGVKVSFAKAEKDTVTKLGDTPEGERPSLIVFDLNNANAKPLSLIPKLKAKLKRGTSVIGFLSHIQGDLKVKAIEAGCDMVMPKSAFSQNLPNLLRRHGLDEELEPVEV